jgi:GT2 family glycosyltransferase
MIKIADEPERGGVSPDQAVAVVILNWNGGEDILDSLRSVYNSTHKATEVVIVDNGSSDGSSDTIRALFPQVHFISNSRNLGFAKGSNQGMQWALDRGIRYILLLNGDARIHPNAIHELVTIVSREDDSVIACPRIYLGGSSGTANRLWFAYGTVQLWVGLFQNPAFNQIDSPRWSQPEDMEYASGCCMAIPARILQQIGLLDESFFAYCEDIDFSLRVRKAGFRLRYVPTAHIWHGSDRPNNRTRTATYRYLSTRNNLWVVRKHGSMFEILTCLCILPLRSLFRIARMAFDGDWGAISAEAKGVRDGLSTRPTTQLGRD